MTHHVRNPIHRHGPLPDGAYTVIRNELVRGSGLTPTQFAVLAVLLSHGEAWEVSPASIAADLDVTRNTARKAIRELQEKRHLVIQAHVTERGTQAFSVYHVNPARGFSEEEMDRYGMPVRLTGSESDRPIPDQVGGQELTCEAVKNCPPGWSNNDRVGDQELTTKEDNTKDQSKEQSKCSQTDEKRTAPASPERENEHQTAPADGHCPKCQVPMVFCSCNDQRMSVRASSYSDEEPPF